MRGVPMAAESAESPQQASGRVLSVGRLRLVRCPDIGAALENLAPMFDTRSMKALIADQLCEDTVKSRTGLARVL